MKTIVSTQNACIKERAKLKNKKERDKSGLYLIEGRHMVDEASAAGILKEVYALSPQAAQGLENITILCSRPVLDKLSQQKSGSDIIGVCTISPLLARKREKVLLLDGIQDPGNLGTLLRSAVAFGMGALILSPECADPYNFKCLQASQGAVFAMPIIKTNLETYIKENPASYYGFALHQNSTPLSRTELNSPYGIVIGNEGQGISQGVLSLCTHLVTIEMAAFESLNAAVAGSIAMYWFFEHGLKAE